MSSAKRDCFLKSFTKRAKSALISETVPTGVAAVPPPVVSSPPPRNVNAANAAAASNTTTRSAATVRLVFSQSDTVGLSDSGGSTSALAGPRLTGSTDSPPKSHLTSSHPSARPGVDGASESAVEKPNPGSRLWSTGSDGTTAAEPDSPGGAGGGGAA